MDSTSVKLAWNLDLQVPRKKEPLSIWTSAKSSLELVVTFKIMCSSNTKLNETSSRVLR
jgi:hypothetical protein